MKGFAYLRYFRGVIFSLSLSNTRHSHKYSSYIDVQKRCPQSVRTIKISGHNPVSYLSYSPSSSFLSPPGELSSDLPTQQGATPSWVLRSTMALRLLLLPSAASFPRGGKSRPSSRQVCCQLRRQHCIQFRHRLVVVSNFNFQLWPDRDAKWRVAFATLTISPRTGERPPGDGLRDPMSPRQLGRLSPTRRASRGGAGRRTRFAPAAIRDNRQPRR